MCTFMRLKQAYFSSDRIMFDDSSRLVFFSDCHRGDNSKADSFLQNRDIYLYALDFYYTNGFTYIELGDGDELWENDRFSALINAHLGVYLLLRKFHLDNRLYMIWGNHDIFKSCKTFVRNTLFQYYDSRTQTSRPLFENIKIHEGLILQHSSNLYKIFTVHGHQGDILNDILWPFSCFMIRHFWRFIKISRCKNRLSQIKNNERLQIIENNIRQWSKNNNIVVIAGHTHNPAFPKPGQPPYFNDGCCIKANYITCIEIQNGEISLTKWSRNIRSQTITREVLSGPEKISAYVNQ
ncbi:metallophosphoesterase [Pseudobacteroides cellulosolvens]|uniref:Metallophosphoesterase n=1 Tax=Pseudobacteroides cellulosolvens ATCC 35603 = DSM 2933 TaxID=398512 RepID=A0A0L6JM90_9FIRM|nr:metallophosphoesterase [Pseudobacteroides cellulosolvens]KNY26870.1 metallophosphoesterase [Pseudobacteroides cellulosolvens ATCC 35603 = DSM 2933]